MRYMVAVFAFAWALIAACGSGAHDPPRPELLGWVSGAAERANGVAPNLDAADVCGSYTATYLSELLDTSPVAAKVQREWADCVEGGKQVMVRGRVAKTHLGPTDLPMSHPYGDDLSMNVDLDPAFFPFAKRLGAETSETTPEQIHVEISAGFIPHLTRPRNAQSGQLYRDAADFNLDRAAFQDGFAEPAIGDPILIMGRWIVDCGHGDFSTELHSASFISWAHASGAQTTVRFYYNPYRDAEIYGPNGAILGKVGDPARLATGDTFPRYLIHQVLGLGDGSVDRLRSLEMIDTTREDPVDWEVCPPAGAGEGALDVRYDIVARPGATVTVTPNQGRGCVTVHAALGTYAPVDADLRTCALPWDYLNHIVQGSTAQPVDLRALLQGYVSTPEAKSRAALDPEASCADALAGPSVSAAPQGQSLRVEQGQPFPFYGVLTVSRGAK